MVEVLDGSMWCIARECASRWRAQLLQHLCAVELVLAANDRRRSRRVEGVGIAGGDFDNQEAHRAYPIGLPSPQVAADAAMHGYTASWTEHQLQQRLRSARLSSHRELPTLAEFADHVAGWEEFDWDNVPQGAIEDPFCRMLGDVLLRKIRRWATIAPREMFAPVGPFVASLTHDERSRAIVDEVLVNVLSLVMEGTGIHYLQDGLAGGHMRTIRSREALVAVPPREQNRLLVAAGFAPHFPERSLDDPALRAAREAVDLVLAGHEPYPSRSLWDRTLELETLYAIEIPHLGSLILTHTWDGQFPGLKEFPREDRPNAAIVFWTFRVMVGLGLLVPLLLALLFIH